MFLWLPSLGVCCRRLFKGTRSSLASTVPLISESVEVLFLGICVQHWQIRGKSFLISPPQSHNVQASARVIRMSSNSLSQTADVWNSVLVSGNVFLVPLLLFNYIGCIVMVTIKHMQKESVDEKSECFIEMKCLLHRPPHTWLDWAWMKQQWGERGNKGPEMEAKTGNTTENVQISSFYSIFHHQYHLSL